MDATITSNPVPTPVPASRLQEGAAQRLGPKVDYNCHGWFTRYTRMPLATGQIYRCSTCPRIRGRQRVLSQNSDCAAGFCSESSTCIWRIKPVGLRTAPTMPASAPEPMEPTHKKPRKSGHLIELSPTKLLEKEEQRRLRNRTRQTRYRQRKFQTVPVVPEPVPAPRIPMVFVESTPAPSIPAESCATTPESIQATPEPAGY